MDRKQSGKGETMRIAHVTVFTKCMEESVAFYETMAGLNIQRDMRGTDHPVVFLADEEGGTCVEMVKAQENAFNGSGIMIGFLVENAEEERSKKEEAGLCPGPLIAPNPHAKFFTVKDPNGVEIQFLQED